MTAVNSHDINGGQKAYASPFTLVAEKQEERPSEINILEDHVGMGWDQDSISYLLSKKYAPYSETPDGRNYVQRLSADPNKTIRDMCEESHYANRCSCVKRKATMKEFVANYILDPLRCTLRCQPVCTVLHLDELHRDLGPSIDYAAMV